MSPVKQIAPEAQHLEAHPSERPVDNRHHDAEGNVDVAVKVENLQKPFALCCVLTGLG